MTCFQLGCWKRPFAMGPEVSLHFTAGYAMNPRAWWLFAWVIFQGCIHWSNFKEKVMSPSGTQSRLAYSLLQTGTFLKFSITVLSCNTTDCMFRQPSDPSMSPLWDLRSKKTKMMFNVACCASDSKVLCLKQKSFMSFASIHETVTGY